MIKLFVRDRCSVVSNKSICDMYIFINKHKFCDLKPEIALAGEGLTFTALF